MNREMLGIGVPDALGTDRERTLTATEDRLPTDLGTQQGALHGITQRTGALITAIRIKGAGTAYHLAKTTRYPRGLASPRIAHIGRILADEAEIQHLTQRINVCSLIGLAEAELLRRGIAACEEMRGVATRAITPLTGGTKVDYDRFPSLMITLLGLRSRWINGGSNARCSSYTASQSPGMIKAAVAWPAPSEATSSMIVLPATYSMTTVSSSP